MIAKIMNFEDDSDLLCKVSVFLLLCFMTKPVAAIEAQKPEISLADQILQENKIHREEFYGDVRLLHSPYPVDIQFSADGSVLFSIAETVRLWRSDTGTYLGSIAGPAKFRRFAQLNNSRWIVTLDDLEAVDERGLYWGVPQVLPNLRIWDVVTGKCLVVRRLEIPVNAIKIWIPTLETAEPFQTTYLILRYTDDRSGSTAQHLLIGFQGRNLTPVCRLELDYPSDSLIWDPYTNQIYINGEYWVSCFDPAANKILWSTTPGSVAEVTEPIDELIVINKQLRIVEGMLKEIKPLPGNKHSSSTIFVSFNRNVNDPTFQEWVLVDPLSSNNIISRNLKNILQPNRNQLEIDKHQTFIYWTHDFNDQSIKSINIFNNELTLNIPWTYGGAAAYTRNKSLSQKWHLVRDDSRTVSSKIIYNQTTNIVCFIGGDSEEINLFNSRTGKRIASASGTVNAQSSISKNQFSTSLDWNEVSMFQFHEDARITRTFSTNVPENSCVALSADANSLLVGDSSGKGHVWNLANHKKIGTLTGVSKKLLCIAVDTSQKKFVAGDINGVFWRWNIPTQSTSTPEKKQRLSAERNGKQIKLSLQDVPLHYELTHSLCDLSSNALLSLCFQPRDLTDNGVELDSTPGLALAAKVIENPKLYYLFKPSHGEVIALENAMKKTILTPGVYHKSVLIQVKSSANGRFAILVFNTGQVTIVDIQTGTLESIIQTNDKEIVDVDYRPDQKTLLVASYRGAVTAWNTDTYLQTGSIKLFDARLDSLSSRVSDNGFDIVLGTRDTGLIVKHGAFRKADMK